ncbi:leucyl aminopeptidase [Corynebacterium tapiri]|uniref:Probable cytosol aminopeptidase n=1 Tax=Corynebacterium tapiri TaxID=1448266 RepID=A0A5C4U7F0_9CORY|nr:leucyl aminopeptidase [Corynebacterium tapiri]TNL99431.1 leucyl aminopeptidase [Corynebacterium tapiri]
MPKLETRLPARGRTPQVELEKKAPKQVDAFLVAVFEGEDATLELPASSLLSSGDTKKIFAALSAVDAKGSLGAVTRVPAPEGVGASAVVAVGLGSPEELDDESVRRAAGVAARTLGSLETVATSLGDFGLAATVEGLLLGGYEYRGLRSERTAEDRPATTFTLVGDPKQDKEEFVSAHITAEQVCFARDLVNTPASHLYPESYAQIIADAAEAAGLKVEILDENKLKAQGFGGILAVGQGSDRAPRVVRLTWKPKKAKSSVALVGKGITFDTGGISLKPGAHMENMISDMGGSAAVVGATIAAARLNLPVAVTATIPLAENMPSGSATRPGDVITHYGGITSEVINTDAEGRLVLADAIARASEDKPDYLIETATLTGAQLVALGARTAGVMGSDQFRDSVARAGQLVGENAWAMPLLEEHDEDIKSPVADIRNHANSRNGGMLFAGAYLSRFVGEGIQWAHIDVAGPSFNEGSAFGYTPKRATGAPVRTIVQCLRDIAVEA